MSDYIFDLEPDDNGTFLATCEAFPEVATYVEDAGMLFVVGLGAVEEAIAARMADGRDIPLPAGPGAMAAVKPDDDGTICKAWVRLPLMTELKVELYRALRSDDITRAELARRLNWNRESVDRLFRLDHASRLSKIDEAFVGLKRRVTFTVADRA